MTLCISQHPGHPYSYASSSNAIVEPYSYTFYQLKVIHVSVPIDVANDGVCVSPGDVEIELSILTPVVLVSWWNMPYQKHLMYPHTVIRRTLRMVIVLSSYVRQRGKKAL